MAKKKRQEKNQPRFGVLQFAAQLSKLEYCSCVMSWPSMVYDLAIAKKSGAFVKNGEGPKIGEMCQGYQDDFQAIPS